MRLPRIPPPRRAALVAALAFSLSSCFLSRDPRYCDRSTQCEDPARPFCDLDGDFEASGFTGNTCIPLPAGACSESSECSGATPICETSAQSCRACAADAECEARDAAAPVCAGDGTCVQCVESVDCPAPAPICAARSCGACQERAECEARDPAAPVCGGDGRCAPCADNADCPDPSAPICDEGGSCRACAEHAECGSSVCDRASGACVAEDDIIYVDADQGSDGAGCGASGSPCQTVGGADGALAKVSGSRVWVRLAAGVYPEAVILSGITVHLAGPEGAEIVPPSTPGDEPAILVEDASDVVVDGLTLRNATGASAGHGLLCRIASGNRPSLTLRGVAIRDNSAAGVSATSCDLTVEQSEIRGNSAAGLSASGCDLTVERTVVLENDAGGVSITDSSFTLQNNVIAQNGTAGPGGSPFGGIRIENTGTFDSQLLEHNSLADNRARTDADSSGMECSTTQSMTARSNIIYANLGATSQLHGNCAHAFSDIEGGATGDGNLDEDPLFADAAAANYHIEAGSPCIDAADPESTLDVDLDGQARPQGDGPDIGADEHAE